MVMFFHVHVYMCTSMHVRTHTHAHAHTQEHDIIKEGMLQRKNELDEGGRKAAIRSWRQHYTVLIGPLLNFYKDKKEFQQVSHSYGFSNYIRIVSGC